MMVCGILEWALLALCVWLVFVVLVMLGTLVGLAIVMHRENKLIDGQLGVFLRRKWEGKGHD